MAEISPGTAQHSLLEAWRKASTEVLSQVLGAPWNVEPQAAESAPASPESYLHFGLACGGGMEGKAAVKIPQADGLTLARKLLAESGEPAELTDAHKEALEKVLRQIATAASAGLQTEYGAVDITVSSAEPPTWPGTSVAMQASENPSSVLHLELFLGEDLAANQAALDGATVAGEQAPVGPGNLDLLLGVGLNVTLRFGQRILTLREILELGSGSVIELDRQVQEPADLLLGDKLIARGEVVIVDGNYGVRVTEVADPRQRLSTL